MISGEKVREDMYIEFKVCMNLDENQNLMYILSNEEAVANAVKEEVGLTPVERDEMMHMIKKFREVFKR